MYMISVHEIDFHVHFLLARVFRRDIVKGLQQPFCSVFARDSTFPRSSESSSESRNAQTWRSDRKPLKRLMSILGSWHTGLKAGVNEMTCYVTKALFLFNTGL